ncbi:Uncharacterised protein [Mycobacteroides abscessus subsp. abscessus]|nr:Uncharacterised protein [Mycobacteroides abscessus subsp. abscessus]SLE79468.1 Uncharacterised protein [Mycobacteroides abscessus subsp. massiliense]
MVALLGHLVEAVTELRGAVGQLHEVLHHAADQDALEGETNLDRVGLTPAADLDLALQRLVAVPLGGTQGVQLGIQHPAGVVAVDLIVRGIPIDVLERVEVQAHRPFRQRLQRLQVLGIECARLGNGEQRHCFLLNCPPI